jgi:hypothetical protein
VFPIFNLNISVYLSVSIQGMSASHNTAAKLSLSNLLSLPARATRVRELTLSQNHVLERNEFPKQRWHFPYARNSLVSFSEVDYKKVLSTGGESQNTEEAGVFISSHALEHSTAAPARKLLQAKDDGDWSVVEVNPLGLRTYAFNLAPDAERLAQVLAFLKASELFRLVSSVKSALALPSRKVHAILVEQISSQSRRLVPGTSLAVKKPTQSASAIQVTAALIETKHDVASAKSISTALRVCSMCACSQSLIFVLIFMFVPALRSIPATRHQQISARRFPLCTMLTCCHSEQNSWVCCCYAWFWCWLLCWFCETTASRRVCLGDRDSDLIKRPTAINIRLAMNNI